MSKITKDQLIKVVDELNDKVVDPPIKKKDEKKMIAKIIKASKYIEPDDEVSKETMNIIKQLKKEAKGGDDEPKKKSKGKKEEKKTAKKGKEKKGASKKKVAGAGTSAYGHKLGCASGAIDEAVADKKGHSIKKIADKLGLTEARVLGHLKHLKNNKGVKMKIDGDKVKVA